MSITINGTSVVVEPSQKDISLLHFLREHCLLRGVKNGCEKGVCGSCTVVLDGKAVRSCRLRTSDAEGKNLITIEGMETPEGRPSSHPAGIHGCRCRPVRLLYTGHDHEFVCPPAFQPGTDPGSDTQSPRRKSVQMHRLSAHHRCRRAGLLLYQRTEPQRPRRLSPVKH